MHAIYNNNKRILICLLPLLVSACEWIKPNIETAPVKESKPISELKVPAVTTATTEEKPCPCGEQGMKEIIKYVDSPCPIQEFIEKPKVEKKKNTRQSEKQIIGRIEYVSLNGTNLAVKARIDTGAKTSSLNALDLTEFERDGKKWVRFAVVNPETKEKVYYERKIKRFVRIKQMATGNQRRPVVMMTIRLGTVEESIEVSLTDRSHYVYQLLIGRNYLLDRMLVDVSQKYVTRP